MRLMRLAVSVVLIGASSCLCGPEPLIFPDAGGQRDGGSQLADGGTPPDAGGLEDSGAPDAGSPDAGVDAGPGDAGGVDAGPGDAGTPDAGAVDGGRDAGFVTVDGGTADAGSTDAGSSCDALTQAQCRLRSDCDEELCMGCQCDPTFGRCKAVTDTRVTCVLLACAMPQCCALQSECIAGQTCQPPGASPGCGICQPGPGTCTQDSQCSAGDICEPRRCACTDAADCVPGCSATNPCKITETCHAPSSRCRPIICLSGSNTCPTDTHCDATSGTCTENTCSTNRDCQSGVCALGICQSAYGICRADAP